MAKKPLQSVPMTDPKTGLIDRSWDLYFREQDQERSSTQSGLDAITLPNGSQQWGVCLVFSYPEDGYDDLIDLPYAVTMLRVAVKTRVGTSTVTVAGDGTLDGGSSAASTTQVITSHTSGNTVAAGGRIRITRASTSADCEGLSVTISGTYTLA